MSSRDFHCPSLLHLQKLRLELTSPPLNTLLPLLSHFLSSPSSNGPRTECHCCDRRGHLTAPATPVDPIRGQMHHAVSHEALSKIPQSIWGFYHRNVELPSSSLAPVNSASTIAAIESESPSSIPSSVSIPYTPSTPPYFSLVLSSSPEPPPRWSTPRHRRHMPPAQLRPPRLPPTTPLCSWNPRSAHAPTNLAPTPPYTTGAILPPRPTAADHLRSSHHRPSVHPTSPVPFQPSPLPRRRSPVGDEPDVEIREQEH